MGLLVNIYLFLPSWVKGDTYRRVTGQSVTSPNSNMSNQNELACVYAALILLDDDVPITVDKLNTILKAASVSVEPYWPGLFAKAAAGLDLKAMVSNVGSGVGTGGGGGGGAAAPAAADAAPAEAKKEEKKESEPEESDDDMGFSLFG